MRKLKTLKLIYNDFVHDINKANEKLENNLSNLKKEYQRNVVEEKMKLLFAISNGEGLDFEKIKVKYLKPKEINSFTLVEPDEKVEQPQIDEDLLDKIEHDGKEYYYEAKEKGVVYDMNSKPVGVFKNGQIIFN